MSDAEAAQRKPPDDRAGCANDDDYADAQPHTHARVFERTRGQHNQRVVVAGLGTPRQLRRDRERDGTVRRKRETLRPERQPPCGRPRSAALRHARSPAQIEREAGTGNVDANALRAGVRHSDRRSRTARQHYVSRRRRQDDWPRRARTGCGRERGEQCSGSTDDRDDHRPMTVNVTVAV
jgi:hypothetical protein